MINSDLHEADLHSLSDFISDDKTLTRDDVEFSDRPDDKFETKITNLTNDKHSNKLSSEKSLSTIKTVGSIKKQRKNSSDTIARKRFSP